MPKKFYEIDPRQKYFYLFDQDDLKNKKNEIQTLEDASTDIMMIEDDEEKVSVTVKVRSYLVEGDEMASSGLEVNACKDGILVHSQRLNYTKLF